MARSFRSSPGHFRKARYAHSSPKCCLLRRKNCVKRLVAPQPKATSKRLKRICVKPGAKLSLQKHWHRSEHWVIVTGCAVVHRDGQEVTLRENESTFIPAGTVHRLTNPGHVELHMIEVQSGAYLGEDDIVRFEDVYNRVTS
mgnify:CR=1 FL=1